VSDSILDALAAMGIDYEVIDCDPQLADTAEFCEHYGYRLDESANAIMVVGKGEPRKYVMCMVLANTQIDVNKTVRKKIGTKKASFARPEEVLEITGMTLGGITPFGLPEDLPLWIDNRVMACSKVIVGGGSRDRKFFLPPEGLEALPNAEVVDGLAKEKIIKNNN
jgi:prolyl-tRNA editing enzyme YbaK/EbsC (Cys-tRNA(Pro) deacylase)